MAHYQSIAVIYGSDSSEWEVACRSGEFTAARIDEFRYDVYEIFARFGSWKLVAMRKANAMRQPFPEGAQPEVDKTDFSVMVLGEKIKFDFAYIMQHGAPGETGLLQGYLEMLGVPHSSCSAFVTTVAFDKYSCKSYLRGADFVKLSPDAFIRQGSDVEAFSEKAVASLGLPLFVKPTAGGSSFGITKVEKAEDLPAATPLQRAIPYWWKPPFPVSMSSPAPCISTERRCVPCRLSKLSPTPAGSTTTPNTTASARRCVRPRFRTPWPRRFRRLPGASTITWAARAWCAWTTYRPRTAFTSWK